MQPANPSEILQSFSLPAGEYEIRQLKQGLINDTFLVSHHRVIRYVLQRINTRVFREPEALMTNLRTALPLLRAEDYHGIELLKTKEGRNYIDARDAGCWRLITYIQGSITHNTTSQPQTAFEAGRILACFHTLIQQANRDDFTTILPGFHSLPLRKKEYMTAMEAAPEERLSQAQEAISLFKGLMEDLPASNMANLPLRVCHNDTKLNNFLFAEADGKALCLIDLDTLMEGYFMYDFGDAVRTIVNSSPEDERNLDRITFSRSLFQEFVRGLATRDGLLTKEEVQSLPIGAIYMPLIHGLRALTDYLNCDRYYQVAYDKQNLDRSRSLFTFARRALEEFLFMEDEVALQLNA